MLLLDSLHAMWTQGSRRSLRRIQKLVQDSEDGYPSDKEERERQEKLVHCEPIESYASFAIERILGMMKKPSLQRHWNKGLTQYVKYTVDRANAQRRRV